jgi:hypothetical protein
MQVLAKRSGVCRVLVEGVNSVSQIEFLMACVLLQQVGKNAPG